MRYLDISLMTRVVIIAHVNPEQRCDDTMIKIQKALDEISFVFLPEKE